MVASRVTTKFGPLATLPAVNGVPVRLTMSKSATRWMITDRVAGKALLAPGAPATPSSKTEPDADSVLLSVSVLAPVLMLVVRGTVELTTKPAGGSPAVTGIGPSISQSKVV